MTELIVHGATFLDLESGELISGSSIRVSGHRNVEVAPASRIMGDVPKLGAAGRTPMAGLTPTRTRRHQNTRAIPEALRSATVVQADLLNRSGELDVVAPGALADLLPVAGKPLADSGAGINLILRGGEIMHHAPRLA